jgi:hypothetical protein
MPGQRPRIIGASGLRARTETLVVGTNFLPPTLGGCGLFFAFVEEFRGSQHHVHLRALARVAHGLDHPCSAYFAGTGLCP